DTDRRAFRVVKAGGLESAVGSDRDVAVTATGRDVVAAEQGPAAAAVVRPPDQAAAGATRTKGGGGADAWAVGSDDVLRAVRSDRDGRLASLVGRRRVDVDRLGEGAGRRRG